MTTRAVHGPLGNVITGREQTAGNAILSPQAAPTTRAQGCNPVEPCASVRWMIAKPADVASYDVQLYRWSEILDAWILDGEPFTGKTDNVTINQSAGAPLFCRIYGFTGPSATGFRRALQGYNPNTI